MDQRWTQIRKLFREALDLEPAQWDRFLESQCPDEEMRQKVLVMLATYDDEDTFLERPAADVGPGAQQRDTTTGLVGSMVGPYQIRRSIARGGMGVVFEALDTKLDKVVALKMMSPALVQDPTFRQRFEQEAKTLARLEDPHFVRVNALIDDGPNTFIVMEYVDGVTLTEHIRNKGPLTGKEAATVGIQLLQALSKAHRQGIVHRDLKPSNIMLTKNYEGRLLVKVLDFGIAKNLAPDGNQTRTVGAVGTLFYMSPEQARGLRTIDYRTDLYSLGVTLYEAVSGDLPFDVGVDEYTVRRQIVEGHVIPLEKRKPETESVLARVIAKALATNPDDRYANAGEMGKALMAVLEEMRGRRMTAEGVTVESADVRSSEFGVRREEGQRVENGERLLGRMLAILGGLALLVFAGAFVYNQFFSGSEPDPIQAETSGVVAGKVDSLEDEPVSLQENAEADSAGNFLEDNLQSGNLLDENTPALEQNNSLEETAQVEIQTPSSESSIPVNPQSGANQADDVSTPAESQVTSSQITLVDENTSVEDPPTPVQTGMLSLKMSPSGSVFVNDELELRNDLVYVDTLTAGRQLVRVENTDYGRWVCAIQIQPDAEQDHTVDFETSVAVTVVAEDIDTNAPISGETIFLDGVPDDATTPEKIRVSTGLHQVSLQMNNYMHVETTVNGGSGCFQQVGSLVNVDPQSIRGLNPPRLVIRMRKIQ